MNVVQLLPELNEGGVERGVVELNRELVAQGVESLVISAGGTQAGQIVADGGHHLTFDVASKNPLSAPQRILALRALLDELQPDIVHARSRVPAWLAYLANRKQRRPFVTTVHGFNSVNAYSRVMTFGDRVICVSGAIKTYIQEHYQVPDEKIVVIPRGVDLQLFDPASVDRDFIAGFKDRYALVGRYVVTSVGRITQLKDYETFIRAVVEARKSIPNITGLIVGGVRHDKQDYYEGLQSLVTSLGAEDFIHFTGSQKKIAEIYVLSDVIVSCSKKPESFGRSAAEALAMNVPVIATNHGGITDVVSHGKSGYLFPVGDVSELASRLIDQREQKFSGLREIVVENFSLQRMTDMTLKVYRSLKTDPQED